MKIRITVLVTLLSVVIPSFGITPTEVLRKTVSKLDAASGIELTFRAESDQGTASGTIWMDGTRSYMNSRQFGSQWFDGKTMWTLNPKTHEVTVSNPEPSELQDANPLLYLQGYENKFRIFFSKRNEAGYYLVLLNPRGASDIKAIEVAVSKQTYLPERFIIRTSEDVRSYINVSNLNLNRKFKASDFIFPASKYKDYEIVDIR